jgi:hypothetical protein
MASSGDSALSEALLDAQRAEDAAPPLTAAVAPPPRPRSTLAWWLRACALLLAAAALGCTVFMLVMADGLSRAFGGNGWHDWLPHRGRPLRFA